MDYDLCHDSDSQMEYDGLSLNAEDFNLLDAL